jgi:general secretion pathway protein B
MSYILDALRRADAEREREHGGVPGLHSMPLGGAVAAAPAAPLRRLAWAVTGAAAVLMVMLAVAWRLWPAPPAQAAAAPNVVSTPAPALSPAPAAAPASSGPSPASSVPAPAVATAAAAMPTPAPAVTRPTAPTAPTTRQAREPRARTPVADTAVGASTPLRVEDQVVAFEQLPDDVKRALPPLAIGGAVYSDNPGSRLLMVGGQLLKEGDTAGAGVTLEQIKPRSAVLRWKDIRYEIRY